MKTLLTMLLLSTATVPAICQDNSVSRGPEISVHWGLVFGGAGHDIKRLMEKAGFDEELSRSGFLQFSDPKNPKRSESGVQIGVSFPVSSFYTLKGLYNLRESTVHGTASDFDILRVNTSNNTVALIGFRQLSFQELGFLKSISSVLRVGVGPTFSNSKTEVLYGESEISKIHSNRPGLALETGLNTPIGKRFFFDLQAQYFYAGRVDAGRHTLTNFHSDNTAMRQRVADFTRTSLNSLQLSFGFGFKFYKST